MWVDRLAGAEPYTLMACAQLGRAPGLAAWAVSMACLVFVWGCAPDGPGVVSGLDADSAEARESLCVQVCSLGAQLSCPKPGDCLTPCEYELRASCMKSTRAFLECVRTKTVRDFYCAPSGASEIKSGVCEPEKAAIVKCVGGGPDLP